MKKWTSKNVLKLKFLGWWRWINQIVTSGTVVTLNNLPEWSLETDYFFSTSSRKNNQFQDFTRADYLVQRPAFGHYLIIIQLLQLVSSADWSKVHHVTQGIFCNDRWWRQPVIIRLSRPVIIYAHASYRFCTASILASCARFLPVEPRPTRATDVQVWTERLIRVKAGRKVPKNLWNYMHLSVLQGKTSLLQIVIHLFLLLFHRVYFFILLTISRHCLHFDFDLVIWVMCFVCIGPIDIWSPLPLHCPCTVYVCQQLQQSQYNALRITKYLRAYWQWKTLINTFARTYVDNGRRLYEVKITRTLHSFHNVNKTRCDVKFVNFHKEMCLKMC